MAHARHTNEIIRRALRSLVRIAVLLMALLAAGVLPIGTGTADAVVGNAGPVTVTVTTVAGTSDPLELSVHAEISGGPVIYGLTAHLCVPGAVRNTYDFGYQSGFCPNAPVGKSDTEKIVPVPGATSADLIGFKVGTGTAEWLDENGFPHSLTCGPTSKCELVVKINYTGTVVFFRAPICWAAADCPADNVPAPVPSTTAPSTSTPSKSGGAAVAAAGATKGGTGSGSGSGGAAGQGGGSTATGTGGTSAAAPSGTKSAAAANGSSSGQAANEVALAGRSASAVSVPTGGLSRSTRVLLAAAVGALCGARIISVLSKARRQAAPGMVTQ